MNEETRGVVRTAARVEGESRRRDASVDVRPRGNRVQTAFPPCGRLLSAQMGSAVTEPTNYTKLSKKITCRDRQFNKLKPV
jgi:hypothetical protein